MKKFILMIMASVLTLGMFAQNTSGSSKFTDNWSVGINGGVTTTFDNYFSGHTACTPIVAISADKYITPVFGVGIDARTAIGTGCNLHNPHTAFDAVNISGYGKINLTNIFAYNGSRRFFEPVVYAGLGWGHNNCSAFPSLSSNYNKGFDGIPTEYCGTSLRNYITARVGTELNFNLGEKRAWAIIVNPSVVWGNIDNGRLVKHNGNFEVTAGVVYHFKTSNGTHGWAKHICPEPREIVKEVIKERTVIKAETKILEYDNFIRVGFAQNSAELTPEGKAILNKIPTDKKVTIYASTSPEGSEARNTELQKERADVVANYLTTRGVKASIATAENARQALIEISK